MKTLAGWRGGLIIALAVALGACGGAAQMIPAGEAPAIRPGEALIVFMRPSNYGGLVASSVFDVSTAESRFVGIVYPGNKFAHAVPAGEHTFMVVGESADFMRATVVAGRTYHALVTPRIGVWKARFSFRPVRQAELDGAEFSEWDSATRFVNNSPASHNWAMQNAADVNSKRAQYWPEWMSKPPHQQLSQTLNAEDGRPTAVAAAATSAPLVSAPAPAAPSSPLVASSAGVEIMFWESIRQSTNPADFQAYLAQYPQGKFAVLARNRLGGPAPAPAAAPVPAAASPKPSGRLPQQGDTWTYRLSEPKRVDGPKQRNYTVKVSAASASAISEEYAIEGDVSGQWTHNGSRDVVPVGRPVFAPYLLAFSDLPSVGGLGRLQIAQGACGSAYLCQASGRIVRRESIKVAAGTFDAVRVEVDQSWRPVAISGQHGGHSFGSRKLTVWYAAAAKRAVKFSSRAVAGDFPPIDTDFDLELVSYQLQ